MSVEKTYNGWTWVDPNKLVVYGDKIYSWNELIEKGFFDIKNVYEFKDHEQINTKNILNFFKCFPVVTLELIKFGNFLEKEYLYNAG